MIEGKSRSIGNAYAIMQFILIKCSVNIYGSP